MKLKFKDYEASGSPKEMAEFLWLTLPKVGCKLPEDFSDMVIEDFKRNGLNGSNGLEINDNKKS